MSSQTVREFEYTGDLWPVVERWAADQGFRLLKREGSERTYRKGRGLLVAPMMVSVSRDRDRVTLTAWIRVNIIVRMMALFLVPAQMEIESGGFRLALPRKIARRSVNLLLETLKQPPVT